MKTIRSLIVAAALAVALARPADAQSPQRRSTNQASAAALAKEDDRAIRKVLADYDTAWNSHDMKALGELFREDAEFINVVGMHWRGRADVVAAHEAYHQTIFKDCRLKTDAIALRPIGSGFAIAVVTQTQDEFTTPAGHVVPKHQNKLSYFFAKNGDQWKIAHGQNVRIDPEAVQHDPVKSPRK